MGEARPPRVVTKRFTCKTLVKTLRKHTKVVAYYSKKNSSLYELTYSNRGYCAQQTNCKNWCKKFYVNAKDKTKCHMGYVLPVGAYCNDSGDNENEVSNLTVVDYNAIPEESKKSLPILNDREEERGLLQVNQNNKGGNNNDTDTQQLAVCSEATTFDDNNINRPSFSVRNSKVSSFINAFNGKCSITL